MTDSLDKKIQHRNAVARAHSQVSRGVTPRLMVKEQPVYSGRWKEILPVVLINIVMTFLTFGIFRFWAKTRVRRYFVSRVSFLNDPLEYTGTGLELFIGFLIVLGILVPISVASALLQVKLVEPAQNFQSLAYYEFGYLLFFYFLYNVAVYRAQRYRLSRMNWRGIRGGQEGSALKYAGYGLVMGALSFVTAGLLYPLMRRVLVGYRINQASFGSKRFVYTGNAGALFAAWMVPWLLFMATIAILFFVSAWQGGQLTIENMEFAFEELAAKIWESYKLPMFAILLLMFIAMIWYRTFEARHWMNNTIFDELKPKSTLSIFHILLPYGAYLLVMIAVSAGVFYGVYQSANSLTTNQTAPGMEAYVIIMSGLVVFFVFWLLGGLLQPIIIQNWLLNNVCATLTLQGSFSPDALFQSQQEIPTSGEGLADALDVDAF